MAALAGFRVVVIDDRAEFANSDRFPDASEIIVPNDFTNALEGLDIDADSYLVIMTRGHRYDRVILEQALRTKAGYVGMMGSLRKRAITYAEMEKRGFTKERLAQVHCPIGLPIKAETPEEIAVSIAAELIRHRANG
jgi:xanthine dehydrogenase accessory factor